MTEDTQSEESNADTQSNESQNQGNDVLEKRYKDLQSWATKLSQEKKELKTQIDEMNGKLALLSQAPVKDEPAPKPFLDDVDASEWIDNPENLKNVIASLKYSQDEIKSSLVKEVKELFELRDKAFDEKLSGVSPENLKKKQLIEQYSEEISEMKDDPDFKDFSEYQLAVMASKSKPKEESVYIPIPSIGGHRVTTQSEVDKKEKEVERLLKKAGYLD